MRGQQADGRIVEEWRKRLFELEAHGQPVRPLGRGDFNGAPQGLQPGNTGEGLRLHGADRVQHVGGRYRGAIMPIQARAQTEVVGEAIGTERETLGQIRNNVSLLIQPRQAVEEQGCHFLIHLVVLAEEGIQVLRVARNTLHERAAPVGNDHGGEAEGGVAQQSDQQRNAQESNDRLPTQVSAHFTQKS